MQMLRTLSEIPLHPVNGSLKALHLLLDFRPRAFQK